MDALRESTKEVKRRSNYAVEQVMKMQKRKTKEERDNFAELLYGTVLRLGSCVPTLEYWVKFKFANIKVCMCCFSIWLYRR